jgi:hypothetical protein
MTRYPFCATIAAILLLLHASFTASGQRLRLIIETDAGGDPDDEQSLVRFLLYANEWDVEGIIANRPTARPGENRNVKRTGLAIVQQLVDAYGQCYSNLVQHDSRYPPHLDLRSRTVAGYNDTDDAVKLLIAAVDKADPRPIWYSDWGTDNGAATNNLKRALDRFLRERGPDAYAAAKNKLRLTSYDMYGEHTTRIKPPFMLWVNTFQPELDRRRWYHRYSGITAGAGGFDLVRDVLTGHGPLGALYPTNTTHWQKEGDTMTFLYLVPTGMNDPDEPTWGSWAGRYGLNEKYPGMRYYWANQLDAWNGTTNRDNTLARWAAHLQNDFKTRLDWCVRKRTEANHPPVLSALEPVRRIATAGERVLLNAGDWTDPDGDSLSFDWFVYPEPGNYAGPRVLIESTRNKTATLQAPNVATEQQLHLVVAVTDSGEPPLTRYRRVVLTVRPITKLPGRRDAQPRPAKAGAPRFHLKQNG